MLFEPIDEHIPSEFLVRIAAESWERRDARQLRHAVFCLEQGLFEGHDRDAIDERAITLVAVACIAGVPDQLVGTVRIHEEEPGLWYGSRLAVHPGFRRMSRIGASLIRLAVGSAHARGCTRFLAHVQSQNAPMFERLHWRTLGVVELHGRPHHHMQADLDHYPPLPGEAGFVVAGTRMPA